MTLSQAAFGADTLLKKAGLVLAGTVLIAIAAKISVPFWPVPVSLQTLAILFIALSFGARMGAVTVLAYLAEGLAGLPVFAGIGAGPAYFAGPTGGFLLGFVIMAYVAGLGAGRGLVTMLGFGLLGAALLYVPGLAWPMFVAETVGIEAKWVGSNWATIWQYWLSPFILADIVKVVLAALAVTGAYTMLKDRLAK